MDVNVSKSGSGHLLGHHYKRAIEAWWTPFLPECLDKTVFSSASRAHFRNLWRQSVVVASTEVRSAHFVSQPLGVVVGKEVEKGGNSTGHFQLLPCSRFD